MPEESVPLRSNPMTQLQLEAADVKQGRPEFDVVRRSPAERGVWVVVPDSPVPGFGACLDPARLEAVAQHVCHMNGQRSSGYRAEWKPWAFRRPSLGSLDLGLGQTLGSVLRAAAQEILHRTDSVHSSVASCTLVSVQWTSMLGVAAHSCIAVALEPGSGSPERDTVRTWQRVSWYPERTQAALLLRSMAAAAPSVDRSHFHMALVVGSRRVGRRTRLLEPSHLLQPGTLLPSQTPSLPLSLSHGACTCARGPCRHRPRRRA
jgi:hypothetical protein